MMMYKEPNGVLNAPKNIAAIWPTVYNNPNRLSKENVTSISLNVYTDFLCLSVMNVILAIC